MNLTKTDKEWITSTIVTSVTQIIKPLEDKVEKNHKELTDKVNELDDKVNKLDDKVEKNHKELTDKINTVNDRLSNIVRLNDLKE